MGVLSSDILTKLENGDPLLEQNRIPLDGTYRYPNEEERAKGLPSVTLFRTEKRHQENIEAVHTFIYGEYIPAD